MSVPSGRPAAPPVDPDALPPTLLPGASHDAVTASAPHTQPTEASLVLGWAREAHQFPARFGKYRVLGVLGEGGMGTVFDAEQEQPHRRVALKTLRPELAAASVLWRFAREAEALGRLQHPGIAQIYEAGTVDGPTGPQPYFAMELVTGRSLTAHAAALASDRERVELAAAVCDAVHYAHQRGVIHRDLKPANILVDGAGQPKVLDFGVARLTDADVQGTAATVAGEVIGTLQYMSPEQLTGDPLDIDVRCDVYALGVILYEMLAGRRPYELVGRQMVEAVHLVLTQEPVSLGTLERRLRGDLETIVAKALEKEPARRYQSAAGLAADLRRHLGHEPITARPATVAYQLRKFARRNRALVGGAGLAAAALAAGTVVSTWQALRARTAERSAEARRAEAVAARAQAEARRTEAVAAGTLAERRRVEADARRLDAERARADAERARAEAEGARAAAVVSATRARQESDKAGAVNAFLQDMLGSADPAVARGRTLTVREVVDDAARRLRGGSLGGQPEVEAAARMTLGTSYLQLGAVDSARAQFEAAHALRRRVHGPGHTDVGVAAASIGQALQEQGDYPAATRRYEEALAIARRTRAPDDDETVRALRFVGYARYTQGRNAEAEALYRDAVARARRRHREPHAVTVNALKGLGEILTFGDRARDAEPVWREALAMARAVHGTTHPDVLGWS
jgi:tetratricopeptide (TPR) repeat protein